MSTFMDRLDETARRNRSLLCVGLDPVLDRMPVKDIAAFNKAIIEATADLVCAYKPNFAFYEAEGMDGLRALEATIAAVPNGIPVILDVKRGDVGHTAEAYAKAAFEVWGADAATVSPYLGRDAVEPFLAYRDRGVFVLARTSNPGAADFQALRLPGAAEDAPLYERVAAAAASWNEAGNVGLVVGATAPDELERIRQLCPGMPILIPGVGPQGGDMEASVRNGVDERGLRAIINASRQVLYASNGADFAEAARREAEKLRDQIDAVRAEAGFPW